MKFGTLTEKQIKAAAGGRLDGLIALWHRDVKDSEGGTIEINLGNRRDSSSPVRGGILTDAAIEIKKEGTRLMVWYDPLELYYEARIKDAGYSSDIIAEMTEMLKEDRDPGAEFDPVSNPDKLDWGQIAAQIGRWLLKFRGFLKLKNENTNFFELETFLNLECGIPALNRVFADADFNGTVLQHKRLVEILEGLSQMDEPSKRVDRALNALRVSNIMEFSVDSDEKTELAALLKEKFPRILSMKDEIDELKSEFTLTEPGGLNLFMKKTVLKYRLPGSWVSMNETAGIF